MAPHHLHSQSHSHSQSRWVPLRSLSGRETFLPYDSGYTDVDMSLDEEHAGLMQHSNHTRSSFLPIWSRTQSESSEKYRARARTTRSLICCILRRPCYMFLVIIGLLTLFSLAWDSAFSFIVQRQDPSIFPGHHPSSFSSWFTHGVNPVPCHSHNDYWRRIPLYSALAAGCTSVEADVWLDSNELRVGHSRKTVLEGQSLRSLYLRPILDILEYNNPSLVNLSDYDGWNNSHVESTSASDPVGIFVNDPAQTLVLLIDFKKNPEEIWALLMRQLAPLRERGFLTHFNGTDMIHRPVTIVGTGDAPFHRILESNPRYVFFDASINGIMHSPDPSIRTSDLTQRQRDSLMFNAENSYYASGDFHKLVGSLVFGKMTQDQLVTLRNQVNAVHARGLKIRYWGTPKWPVGLRNYLWRIFVREDVDILNVDDLYGATRQDWQSRGWWS